MDSRTRWTELLRRVLPTGEWGSGESIEVETLPEITELLEARTTGGPPPTGPEEVAGIYFGESEREVAGSLVSLGVRLLDACFRSPPVPVEHREATQTALARDATVESATLAAALLAHHLTDYATVRLTFAQEGLGEAWPDPPIEYAQFQWPIRHYFTLPKDRLLQAEGNPYGVFADFDLGSGLGPDEPTVETPYTLAVEGNAQDSEVDAETRRAHWQAAHNYFEGVGARRALGVVFGRQLPVPAPPNGGVTTTLDRFDLHRGWVRAERGLDLLAELVWRRVEGAPACWQE